MLILILNIEKKRALRNKLWREKNKQIAKDYNDINA